MNCTLNTLVTIYQTCRHGHHQEIGPVKQGLYKSGSEGVLQKLLKKDCLFNGFKFMSVKCFSVSL